VAVTEASGSGPRPFEQRVADAVELVAEGVGQQKASDRFGVGRYGIQENAARA
jgi:hypothetical protein